MGFFLKKFISRFLFPVPLIAGLLLLGLLFLCSKRWPKPRPKLGKILIAASTVLYLLLHYSFIPNMLLEPIEYRYPAHLPNASIATSKLDHATGQANGLVNLASIGHSAVGYSLPLPEFIIVFSQGLESSIDLPVTSRISETFLARIMEAVRLGRIYPDAQIIVSLCNSKISLDEKRQWLDEFSSVVGMDKGSMDLITGALDTNDEVNQFKEIVVDKRVIAVSSASHIPRIMMMLKRNGIDAVPAPCGHEIRHGDSGGPFNPAGLFPSAGSMDNAETAIYSRLGMLWEWMTGKRGK